jgi:hypothetical protein
MNLQVFLLTNVLLTALLIAQLTQLLAKVVQYALMKISALVSITGTSKSTILLVRLPQSQMDMILKLAIAFF